MAFVLMLVVPSLGLLSLGGVPFAAAETEFRYAEDWEAGSGDWSLDTDTGTIDCGKWSQGCSLKVLPMGSRARSHEVPLDVRLERETVVSFDFLPTDRSGPSDFWLYLLFDDDSRLEVHLTDNTFPVWNHWVSVNYQGGRSTYGHWGSLLEWATATVRIKPVDRVVEVDVRGPGAYCISSVNADCQPARVAFPLSTGSLTAMGIGSVGGNGHLAPDPMYFDNFRITTDPLLPVAMPDVPPEEPEPSPAVGLVRYFLDDCFVDVPVGAAAVLPAESGGNPCGSTTPHTFAFASRFDRVDAESVNLVVTVEPLTANVPGAVFSNRVGAGYLGQNVGFRVHGESVLPKVPPDLPPTPGVPIPPSVPSVPIPPSVPSVPTIRVGPCVIFPGPVRCEVKSDGSPATPLVGPTTGVGGAATFELAVALRNLDPARTSLSSVGLKAYCRPVEVHVDVRAVGDGAGGIPAVAYSHGEAFTPSSAAWVEAALDAPPEGVRDASFSVTHSTCERQLPRYQNAVTVRVPGVRDVDARFGNLTASLESIPETFTAQWQSRVDEDGSTFDFNLTVSEGVRTPSGVLTLGDETTIHVQNAPRFIDVHGSYAPVVGGAPALEALSVNAAGAVGAGTDVAYRFASANSADEVDIVVTALERLTLDVAPGEGTVHAFATFVDAAGTLSLDGTTVLADGSTIRLKGWQEGGLVLDHLRLLVLDGNLATGEMRVQSYFESGAGVISFGAEGRDDAGAYAWSGHLEGRDLSGLTTYVTFDGAVRVSFIYSDPHGLRPLSAFAEVADVGALAVQGIPPHTSVRFTPGFGSVATVDVSSYAHAIRHITWDSFDATRLSQVKSLDVRELKELHVRRDNLGQTFVDDAVFMPGSGSLDMLVASRGPFRDGEHHNFETRITGNGLDRIQYWDRLEEPAVRIAAALAPSHSLHVHRDDVTGDDWDREVWITHRDPGSWLPAYKLTVGVGLLEYLNNVQAGECWQPFELFTPQDVEICAARFV